MRKSYHTSDIAKHAPRQSSGELASLNRAMRASEDSLAGLHRMLKVPTTKKPRSVIKGTTTRNSFYQSAAQIATQISNAASLAQRIL